jgi:uncharacterized protein (TIGR03083 family)
VNPDQIWQAIDTQRADLCDLLADLNDDEWCQDSLCTGWTVRDVAAHLTMQQLGLRDVVSVMRKWRGSMDRTTAHVARLRAAELTTEQLIAGIRGMIGSRRHTLGVTYLETLCDILVHSQDIAIPLGRHLDVPAAAAAVAVTRALSMRWPPPLPSAKKLAGFHVTATDATWSTGEGPTVQGPMAALLLVYCGRLTALPQLTGEGAAALTARLAPQPTAEHP